MKFIKPGDIVIVDQENKLNQTLESAILAKVLTCYFGSSKIVNLNFVNNHDGYIQDIESNAYIISNKYLKPLKETNIIIRSPVDTPVITEKDIESMNSIVRSYKQGKEPKKSDINRLEMIISKSLIFKQLFEV